MTEFEENHIDVLQNIESGIVQVYRSNPQLLDVDVEHALEGLIRAYQAEVRGRAAPAVRLSPPAQQVYETVKAVCDWRLGREHLYDDAGRPVDVGLTPLTPEEIVACLKRIRKSVTLWTKERGRRGYLSYIIQFIS
ncbi:MAG: hypothetical protein NZM11_00255 [Anaerolineales bacterium]|nr:hypothetical protein [Anaerolineales bacterium]